MFSVAKLLTSNYSKHHLQKQTTVFICAVRYHSHKLRGGGQLQTDSDLYVTTHDK